MKVSDALKITEDANNRFRKQLEESFFQLMDKHVYPEIRVEAEKGENMVSFRWGENKIFTDIKEDSKRAILHTMMIERLMCDGFSISDGPGRVFIKWRR